MLCVLLCMPAFAQNNESLPEFELINLGRKVNSAYHDSSPRISPDGQTLYFTVTNHPDNNKGIDGSQDIWCTVKDAAGEWSEAIHMEAPFNKNKYNQVLSISKDGNTLLIRGGNGKDGLGFSICRKVNGKWEKPEALDIPEFEELCKGRFNGAFLSYDGQVLLLYFNEIVGQKFSDLYISFKNESNNWSKPVFIDCLNTKLDEFGPYLAPDNKTMYFASNRPGGFGSTDVYRTQRLDDTWMKWAEPENMGAPVNTKGFDAYYTVADADSLMFTSRAYMSADGGHLDLYALKRIIREKPKIFLTGGVYNEKTRDAIQANIRYEHNDEVIGVAKTKGDYLEYKVELPEEGKYILNVNTEGFFAYADSLEFGEVTQDTVIFKDLYIKPIEIGVSVRLNNIFFDYNKTTLRPKSFPELDHVVEMLQQNENLQIEIGGHTDDRGTEIYNQELSQGRAEAVREYLLQNLIVPERVTAVGYGESKPEVANDSEESWQINRRVEFTILKN